jgi:branched-chain amino acid transport system ATP-binding protein
MLSLAGVSIGHPHRPLAVRDATMHVGPGEFVGIIGTNGSGKSELVQGIAGLIPVQEGRIALNDRRLDGLSAHRLATSGVALVPEGRHVFVELTVRENLEVAVPRRKRHLIAGVLQRFPILTERADQPAGALSGGEQQQLAIARALLMEPEVILLDEPSAGLSPLMVNLVYEQLEQSRGSMAIVVVEQVASLLMHRVDRLYVMRAGRIVKHARPEELSDPMELRRLYFGESGPEVGHTAPSQLT